MCSSDLVRGGNRPWGGGCPAVVGRQEPGARSLPVAGEVKEVLRRRSARRGQLRRKAGQPAGNAGFLVSSMRMFTVLHRYAIRMYIPHFRVGRWVGGGRVQTSAAPLSNPRCPAAPQRQMPSGGASNPAGRRCRGATEPSDMRLGGTTGGFTPPAPPVEYFCKVKPGSGIVAVAVQPCIRSRRSCAARRCPSSPSEALCRAAGGATARTPRSSSHWCVAILT